tara:strand:- start:1619 stop:1822 length:204 start_codon:yes stop_codon:yes gene_type:complete
MVKNKYIRSVKLVNEIQKIRSKNNKNWMDLLKLALKLDHKRASEILMQIHKQDTKISNIVLKIKKIK